MVKQSALQLASMIKHTMSLNRVLIGVIYLFTSYIVTSFGLAYAGEQTQEKQETEAQDAQSSNPSIDKSTEEDAEPERELTASQLNARQRIEQTVTVKRRINGKIIEEKKVSVPEFTDTPYYDTESGTTAKQIIRNQVDREVLTRREVLAEADIDFTLADINRDNILTQKEYLQLWSIRQDDINYKAVLDALNLSDNRNINPRIALGMGEKFNFMTGITSRLNQKEYITEVLRDFDSMDVNGDYILRGQELINFRTISLGLPLK